MPLTQKRSLFVNTNLTTLVLLVDNGSLRLLLVSSLLTCASHVASYVTSSLVVQYKNDFDGRIVRAIKIYNSMNLNMEGFVFEV